MATVAVTLNKVFVSGDRKEVLATVTLTGSYVAGGEVPPNSLSWAQALGLENELNDIDCDDALVTGGILAARYNDTTFKIQLFGAVDATPAVNELSPELGAVAIPGGPASIRLRATGKGSAAA